ncbi:hypothetical protein [Saccharothrix carnea]|uniref:hypothetical protein n=1 Tax=Saccharothrix carnea TaxID=1280637 RepID=UPI0011B1FFB9|nr:hypothetical protein [Saccharothrix carnea]
MAPLTAGAPAAVDVIGPLWTTVGSSTPEIRTSGAAAESRSYGRPGHDPVPLGPGLAVLAGATGTASSGGNAGGSPGQADLPGYQGQGVGHRDGVDVVPVERWLVRPWCYVFGRHHPS